MDRVFGPAFLVMHADETSYGDIAMVDFDVGSGADLFSKDYEREHATSKGPVKESTHVKLRHTPK